jgi:hypothetical protein
VLSTPVRLQIGGSVAKRLMWIADGRLFSDLNQLKSDLSLDDAQASKKIGYIALKK